MRQSETDDAGLDVGDFAFEFELETCEEEQTTYGPA